MHRITKGSRVGIRARMRESIVALAVVAVLALASPAPALAATALPFSVDNASAHIQALCANGPRVEGSVAEHAAFDYIAAQLGASGYQVVIKDVRLPKGKFTHNLIAEKKGVSTRVVLLGAHVDTKYPAPGANDNGSGVATLIELARVLRYADTQPTVRFVFFGGEERSDKHANHHHYGSRAYVRSLSRVQQRRIKGMVSVDMVGYGSVFNVRTMGIGPRTVLKSLRRSASRQKLKLPYLADKSRYGSSDHEPFERKSIPAAWLEWRRDPTCHTSKDAPGHVSPRRVATSGTFISNWLTQMGAAELRSLRR